MGTSCFFDQVHKKQQVGISAFTDTQFRFPRDANGVVIAPEDWTTEIIYNDEAYQQTHKFEKEARFTFGVGVVLVADSNSQDGWKKEGKRCRVFDYTNKKWST